MILVEVKPTELGCFAFQLLCMQTRFSISLSSSPIGVKTSTVVLIVCLKDLNKTHRSFSSFLLDCKLSSRRDTSGWVRINIILEL